MIHFSEQPFTIIALKFLFLIVQVALLVFLPYFRINYCLLFFLGPGKRWRHSMAISPVYKLSDDTSIQSMAIFGGHRLWHGYSAENSYLNDYSSYISRPIGGYLNDLWIYTKWLDYSFPGSAYKANNGKWQIKKPKEQCYASPGLAWDTRSVIAFLCTFSLILMTFRNDYACTTVYPTGRAGHGSAWDDKRNRIWIFGGYNTYFPYPSTDGIGSGAGVASVGSGGFIPYPGYSYFLNDLWYYNLTTNLWVQVELAADSPIPEPRVDAVFLLLGDVFFMHGRFIHVKRIHF